MHGQGGPSDADLVRTALDAATADERTAAFTAIADRHRQDVLRQCASWYPDPETAMEVGQATFEAAFSMLARGQGPSVPARLGGWLIEIARRRGQEYIRKRRPTGVYWAELPEGRGLDETEDDAEARSGSATRRAHVTRLVDRVVATLTEQQQEIYRLRFVEELTGRQAAAQLGISDKAASNEATLVQKLIADGFGALILMQEGRTYCPVLAGILDDAAATRTTAVAASAFATPPDLNVFTAVLRLRIVNHFNECNVCDNCRTCDEKRRQLVGPYAPALIPILFAAEFRDRIDEVIRRVTRRVHPEQTEHELAAHGPGAEAGPRVPLAMAGTAAAVGAGGMLASLMQSLVRTASQSPRSPHWLRRYLPRDPSRRLSVAIVTGALAVVVLLIAAIAVAATGGGSANPPSLAAPGAVATGTAQAAANSGAGAAQAPSTAGSCAGVGATSLSGTVPPPGNSASLASAMDQVVENCVGGTLSYTCSAPFNSGTYDDYTCTAPPQDNAELQKVSLVGTATVYLTTATGEWIAYY